MAEQRLTNKYPKIEDVLRVSFISKDPVKDLDDERSSITS